MLSRDKRASLSSSLLGAKESAPASAEEGGAGDGREEKAAPEARDNVLYAKGNASASGFRPWYWSYQRGGSDGAGTVMPFPASAPAPADTSALAGPQAAAPSEESDAGGASETPVRPHADVDEDFAAKAQAITRARLQRPPAAAGPDRHESGRSRLFLILGGIASLVAAAAGGAFFALSLDHSDRAPAAPPPIAAAQPVPPIPAPPVAAAPSPKPAESAAAKPAAPAPLKPQPPEPAARAESKPAVEAHQAPPPPPAAVAPAPAPAAKPAPTLSPQEIAELMTRGDQLLATGDIAAARLFYERAAEQGSAAAATAAGKTYDPLFLEEVHARGIRGDPVMAAQWYRKASAAGDREADTRMERLIARYGG